MAKLCLSNMSKSQVPSLIFSDFALFCSFIFSHPLYLSYFIFFSPYLLKLFSFLSPLFITTSLLLLALIFQNFTPKLSDPDASFVLSTLHAVIDRLQPKVGQELQVEEFEAYKIVFLFEQASTFDLTESPFKFYELKAEVNCLQEMDQGFVPNYDANLEESHYKVVESMNLCVMEEDDMEVEDYFIAEEKLGDDDMGDTESNKVVKEHEQESKVINGSEAKDINTKRSDSRGEYTKKVTLHAKLLCQNGTSISNGGEYCSNFGNAGLNLGSYGSMRREKEWKRTLACKLYEERHNVVEGDEGMDSLWEAYDSDSCKFRPRGDDKKKNMKKKSNTEIDYYGDEDEDEELEMSNGQLCCLQALKFSAGKMNFGMGRPNLVKISKALKGIGWLHHVKRQSSKKERS